MHIDKATIDAVLDDWTTAPISERLRAGLRLVETLTKDPQALDAAFLESLRAAGLDDEALEDAANVGFHFNFINRMADALEFPILDDAQRLATAKLLDFVGRRTGGRAPRPSYVRGADGRLRPVEVEAGRRAMLRRLGETDPAVREAVEAAAAKWFGGQRDAATELDPPVAVYVEKVARWAYKVLDEDIEALKQAGYTEQAIFELTFAAAFGASVPALERLFGLIYPE